MQTKYYENRTDSESSRDGINLNQKENKMDVFPQIKEFLDQHTVEYKVIEHPPTKTSEESALHRGEPLKIGAKALVVKIDTAFHLFIIPANRKLDTKKIKMLFNSKSLRFATPEELMQLTGLVPGSVPPFGNLLKIPMMVDKALLEEEYMAFNAGLLTTSIKMKVQDYVRILQPRMEEISLLEVKG